jgi:hypothetical protein
MDANALRYVVLRHEGIPDPHYDLMWEWRRGSPLMAIRCHEWPMQPDTPFERLPDHRPIYLDYEGPLSGNRGKVSRVASGICEFEVDREDSSLLRLDTGLELRIPRS